MPDLSETLDVDMEKELNRANEVAKFECVCVIPFMFGNALYNSR